MTPRTRSRLARTVTLSVLALAPVAGALPGSLAADAPRGTSETPSRLAPAQAARATADVELPRTVRGVTAVRLLGEQVDEAAALNGLEADELVDLLREDPAVWLSSQGRAYYRDPAPEHAAGGAPLAAPDLAAADTFQLHSSPGSTRKIFLDFDGATVGSGWWKEDHPELDTSHPAWDPAGDGPAFSDGERSQVKAIWAAVSEDFAPFDVDVTTEDPGPAGILRTSASDLRYGAHALVSPSTALDTICGGGCGGIAWVDVFGRHGAGWDAGGNGYGVATPAWVFPQALHHDPKNIAEALSHEVGHNLSLRHDGNASQGYDPGHGGWAPIMGVGYGEPVSQWSKGDYVGADNQQDDVAALVNRLSTRADEAGAGIAGAPEVPLAGGLVTTRSDVDTYALGSCTGTLTVAADVAATAPNLDVQLRLLDSTGAVVAASNPPLARLSRTTADGLSASMTRTVATDTYSVSVDGVGNGTWATGYDDYASLGRYDLRVTGSCGDVTPSETPSAPTSLAVVGQPTTTSVTVSWSAPADEGSSPVTGYALSSSSGHTATLGSDATSHTISGLEPGTTYTVDVAAVNGSGAGQPVSLSVTTDAVPAESPDAPQTLTATWDPTQELGVLAWTPPLDDGGSPVTGYSISVDGVSLGPVGGNIRAIGVTQVPPGTYDVAVWAVNAVGPGPAATADLVVPKVASRTVLRAPRTARVGTRPVVRVSVTQAGAPARGALVLTHRNGKRTLTLRNGATQLRLPKQRVGRNRITASYRGNAVTLRSLARKTIRVRR